VARGQPLDDLPPEIGNLTSPTTLDLSHNSLTALPSEIGNLTGLTELRLNGNKLTQLPTEMGTLIERGIIRVLVLGGDDFKKKYRIRTAAVQADAGAFVCLGKRPGARRPRDPIYFPWSKRNNHPVGEVTDRNCGTCHYMESSERSSYTILAECFRETSSRFHKPGRDGH